MSTDVEVAVEPAAISTTPARHERRSKVTEGRIVFVASALCYLGVAWWFWRSHLIPGDSISRVANAYYILFSRDAHLAAVGFVWNPLPSLVLLPVLPLKAIFPALTHDGLIVVLCSALIMAGTIAACNDILRRLELTRAVRVALTLLLALHPMMAIYAGNGMSEALFMFLLVLATRSMLQWFADRRAESLVPLGLILGLTYGARYEALAPALAVPAVVAAVSWWRARHRPNWRFATAQADAVLVGLPAALSVAGWALASKIIVDQWFATFASGYGNSAQVAANARGIESVTGETVDARIGYGLQQLLGLEPMVPLLLIAAAVMAVRRRDPRILAPLAVFAPVLAFDNLTFLSGNSFGWLRFQITVVPLAILLAGLLLAPSRRAVPPSGPGAAPGRARRIAARALRPAVVLAALAAIAVAIPATLVTLTTPTLAREESEWFTENGARRTAGLTQLNARIARELDDMTLPEGAVITDAAYAFAIILASRHPRQFVITSDRDFPAALADPRGHHVRYLLVSANGAADAVRAAQPGSGSANPDRQAIRAWTDEWGVVLWTLVPVAEGQ